MSQEVDNLNSKKLDLGKIEHDSADRVDKHANKVKIIQNKIQDLKERIRQMNLLPDTELCNKFMNLDVNQLYAKINEANDYLNNCRYDKCVHKNYLSKKIPFLIQPCQ